MSDQASSSGGDLKVTKTTRTTKRTSWSHYWEEIGIPMDSPPPSGPPSAPLAPEQRQMMEMLRSSPDLIDPPVPVAGGKGRDRQIKDYSVIREVDTTPFNIEPT